MIANENKKKRFRLIRKSDKYQCIYPHRMSLKG